MKPDEFGQFTLINTNALFTYMLAGSWLISIANRSLASDQDTIDTQTISAILSAILVIVAVVLLVGVLYGTNYPQQRNLALATSALAVVFIVYDVTLAVKNAVGREVAYTYFALSRNILTLILSVAFVVAGIGAFGPVAGLLIGTAIPILFFSSVRSTWTAARPSWRALGSLRKHLSLGLSGGLILSIYILVNAPTRNLIGQWFGTTEAGLWTLCADLFYGPLAVLGNAYALSRLRLIYLAAGAGDAKALDRHGRAFLEFTLAIAVPYALGGYLFAEDAMKMALSKEQALIAVAIAVPAAIQSATLLILYCLAAVALAHRRFGIVAAMVVTTALAASIAAHTGDSLSGVAWGSAIGTLAATMFWLVWSIQLIQLCWGETAKLLFSTAALFAASLATAEFLDFPGSWTVAAGAGAVVFAGAALALKLRGFLDALPSVMQPSTFKNSE